MNPALTQLFLQQLLSQSLPVQAAVAPIPGPVSVNVPALPASSSAPPSPTKLIRLPRPVSCHDFCDRYEVSPGDEAKLDALEFIPGDWSIERLGRENWQGDAGFTKLGWDRILQKHKEFLADVSKGSWDIDLSAI
jgi:hypothetical protein